MDPAGAPSVEGSASRLTAPFYASNTRLRDTSSMDAASQPIRFVDGARVTVVTRVFYCTAAVLLVQYYYLQYNQYLYFLFLAHFSDFTFEPQWHTLHVLYTHMA